MPGWRRFISTGCNTVAISARKHSRSALRTHGVQNRCSGRWYAGREVVMRTRYPGSLGFLTLAAAVAVMFPIEVNAQHPTSNTTDKKPAPVRQWKPSLTSDGQPDLQGIWLNNS